MSGTTPAGASAPRTTLDQLAQRLITKMVIHEVVSVGIVALSMFLVWSGPGRPLGTVLVFIVGVIVIARVWMLPARDLRPVPSETATDPNAAADQLTALADRTLRTLQVPTVVGFLATLVSWGWQPVIFGSLFTIAGCTFFGPSRTRLADWKERLEATGGKTGL